MRKVTPPDDNQLYAMKVLKKATLKGAVTSSVIPSCIQTRYIVRAELAPLAPQTLPASVDTERGPGSVLPSDSSFSSPQ